jgi:methylmalonyl-CoA mutase, N-terminal domain
VQRRVARQAYEYEKKLQTGEAIKVGVNKYTEGSNMEVELHQYDESWGKRQIEKLKELKRTRDGHAVTSTLTALSDAAKSGKNVMPYLVACCKAYATVGEMANVFRDAFGEFNEPSLF